MKWRQIMTEGSAPARVEIIRRVMWEKGKERKYRMKKEERSNTRELKIFIWDDFDPDYTSGLAFAIAITEDEARKLVEKERGYRVLYWGDVEVRPLSKCARCVTGGA